MKTICLLLLTLFTAPCFAQQDAGALPQPVGVVNDFEHLFTEEQVTSLTDQVKRAQLEADVSIVIVTLDGEKVTKEQFERYTLNLANSWGVGEKGKDNGILIAISHKLHRIRIHNGDGIVPLLSDELTRDIIDHYIIPKFLAYNYYEGTQNGITEIVRVFKEKKEKH